MRKAALIVVTVVVAVVFALGLLTMLELARIMDSL